MQMIIPFIVITFVLTYRVSKCTDTNLVMEKLVNLTKLTKTISQPVIDLENYESKVVMT